MRKRVLVTGVTGFVAKHVALALLKRGCTVRGTVRSAASAGSLRDVFESHGVDPSSVDFVEADLLSDDGWAEAARGCGFVQHVASPFPIDQPRDREALVPAAREGALRVLRAAREADVRRIVFTSSMVAMMYRADRPVKFRVSESDWTDPEWESLSAYQVSKTRAEMAAWEWADANGWKDRLTVINPGFVLGPSLDDRVGTSLEAVQLIMRGAYPTLPPVGFPVVDVRDLAELHVAAMTVEDAAGRRLIGASETLTMAQMARILKELYPANRKIPLRTLPPVLIRLLSVFDRRLRSIIPDLGILPEADSSYVTELTGVGFRPAVEAVQASAHSLVKRGLV
jgi:dihydroflavonol-4-reductase